MKQIFRTLNFVYFLVQNLFYRGMISKKIYCYEMGQRHFIINFFFSAGVRMKYPSCFVLLVDDRPVLDTGMPRPNNMHHGGLLGSTGLHEEAALLGDTRGRTLEPVSDLTSKTNRAFSSKLIDRIGQDNCLTAGLSKK
jgi:hypothetical protein